MNDSDITKHSYLVTPLPVLPNNAENTKETAQEKEDNGIMVPREKIKELNRYIRTARRLKENYLKLKDDYIALQEQYALKKINNYVNELKLLDFTDNPQAMSFINKIEEHLASVIKDRRA